MIAKWATRQRAYNSNYVLSVVCGDSSSVWVRSDQRKLLLQSKGAFSSVYEGLTKEGRRVAVKHIVKHVTSQAEVEKLKKEGNMLKEVSELKN